MADQKDVQPSPESNKRAASREGDGRQKGRQFKLAVTSVLIAVATWYLTQEFLPRRIEQASPIITYVVLDDPAIYNKDFFDWIGYSYIIDSEVVGPTPLGDCRWLHEWAHNNGGIDAESTILDIVIRGNREVEVTLDNVALQVVDEAPPRDGRHVACPPAGGADVFPFGLLIRLDEQTFELGRHEGMLPKKLSFGDVEYLKIEATAEAAYFEWYLHVHVTDDRGGEWVRIDDNGEPFRTTSAGDNPRVYWDGQGWKLLGY